MSSDMMAVSYAALILQDEGMPIDAAGMEKILAAAGCKAPGYYACMVEKASKCFDLKELITAASTPGAGGGGGGAAAPAAAGAAAAPAKKAAPPPEEEEEDMGFSLFD